MATIRQRALVVGLLVAAVVAAAAAWTRLGVGGQADPAAAGEALLAAVAREVHARYIDRTVDDARLYAGAEKAVLEAVGPACARRVHPPDATPVGRQRVAALVRDIPRRCAPAPDLTQVYFAAARGMLEALGDPYTRFLDPRAYQEFKQDAQGFFFGIGIFIDIKDGHLIVVQPIPGTPAARAGLRAGDRIEAIDGVPTEGMALQEAVVRIRGPQGTAVRLAVRRGERRFEVTIVRDRIEIVAAEGPDQLDDATRARLRQLDIGYIRLVTFNENTEAAFARLLRQVQSDGARGLLLDLRNNGGGLLDISLQVADHFVPAGQPLVHTVDRSGRQQTERASRRAKVRIPVVVLVNEFTASASEIVSGALQDHRIAPLVGVTTFGKGVIQTVVDLPLGSGAAITTAKYLTPAGRDIHGRGLTPDVRAGETEEALRQRMRGQSENAIEQALQAMQAEQLRQAVDVLRRRLQRSGRPPAVPASGAAAPAA
ncbi:MAG: S41 family peptidase [Armatimonadota bacterium]|nr:S41 family peptidase [Armatimonadota bacterium]MDR7612609.1 S41 family peptidase [Armatimonadota bacterium]